MINFNKIISSLISWKLLKATKKTLSLPVIFSTTTEVSGNRFGSNHLFLFQRKHKTQSNRGYLFNLFSLYYNFPFCSKMKTLEAFPWRALPFSRQNRVAAVVALPATAFRAIPFGANGAGRPRLFSAQHFKTKPALALNKACLLFYSLKLFRLWTCI